ncbi:ATPase [Nostoc linckia z18]|jgi:signal transduction histidine kinase|uniref:Circadian input-output histidine kinase CikA n=2 Tax=Nostoc linckia TaxID=92942 RepID=A0A9Q5Z681_NOSLI|nr:HAMP domain-containing sensor histidine kinase [Nostoc linckia]PHK36349.1 ATPase [Nostoc linckia z15]PHK42179.1 ATPase [Nostoc linckia z16]PHJ55890.1 ATPase [Nostoc linckia z1]PHJ58784.1 ATPase [Nostoc linckia z2]PHJ60386.1 ATPase [Nostoc linckia z3]
MDFSQTLIAKSDAIIDEWVEAVYQDEQIEATQELTFKAVRDSLPRILKALATVLSESATSDLQTVVDASLEHGTLRAQQGFEPAEIAREYRLLRFVIFSFLEEDLLQGSAQEVLRAVRLIDTVIDEAIARCFNSYTQERLEELKQLQSQLRLTNQELTRLVRASKESLSHLAHELKTPLTSIIGYADLFLRQQRQQPELKDTYTNLESIERVLKSGRLLVQLINDTLEISRYGAGQMKLQSTQIDVRSLINSVIEMIEPLVAAKELSLVVECERAPNEVTIDPLRFQQILTNLLSNAIRYTESGSIHLHCWRISQQQWAISVTDTGIGISPDVQTQIFNPYFRELTAPKVQSSDGTGLGLAIVSQLVQLMHGEIQVDSQLGKGSTFTVILPINSEN